MKKLTLITLLMVISVTAFANDYRHEKTRVTEKAFKVSSNSSLTLNTKYADVNIALWDRNEIAVKAELKGSASSQSTVDLIMDLIKIDINMSGNAVSVTNYTEEHRQKLNNYSYKLTYTINIPRDSRMSIVNKYGNVNLPAINRPLTVENKYGNLRINDMIAASATIDVKYGNIDIAKAKAKLNVVLKYGNIKMGDVEELQIESGYCKLSALSVKSLTGYSKYDQYQIDRLGSINLSGSGYGGFKIGVLSDKLSLEGLRYSNLKIDKVESSFSSINIPEAGYTDIKLCIPSGSFRANLSVKYGKASVYDLASSDGNLSMPVGSNPTSTISITNKYGNISIYR